MHYFYILINLYEKIVVLIIIEFLSRHYFS